MSSNRLPASPSYICNGLFLCRNCDKHFEDHIITIDGKGNISINDALLRTNQYKKYHNKKVVWSNEIDTNVDWPTSAALDYRNTLAPVLGEHRKLEFGVEEDDKSTSSENDEPTGKRKRVVKSNNKPKSPKLRKVSVVKTKKGK